MKVFKKRFFLIAAYLLHAGYGNAVLEEFYKELRRWILSGRQLNFNLIVAGDFQTDIDEEFR
eukprot:3409602-Karenia_brevis.AAC.1